VDCTTKDKWLQLLVEI